MRILWVVDSPGFEPGVRRSCSLASLVRGCDWQGFKSGLNHSHSLAPMDSPGLDQSPAPAEASVQRSSVFAVEVVVIESGSLQELPP